MQPNERLTTKEIRVSRLVWEGLTNREIATLVGTTEQVIKNYLRDTFDKLGVWSRLELALYVAHHGGAKWKESVSTP
jgi:DNA-binding NarL/FixJ family response regulator